jgi:ADP-ribose pyrophosphatase YjhB (NUDIX family)
MRHGGVRLVFYLAVLVGVLVGISVAGPASTGVPAATASSLDVLWQVQAASVGIVVTLVVFVFGLLPARSRGMLTYRQFLRRTHAIDLTLFNVGSLLFIGLVLLGVGHQVPLTPTTGAHGWALTVATITALVSIASIVVLLALTVRALDPAENEAVLTEYRRRVLAQEVRRELRERANLSVTSVLSQAGVIEFALRDSATVREALAAWKMPELPLLGDALGTDPGTGSPTAPRYLGKPVDATSALWQLGESLRGARDGMDAMKLQLLAEAIKAEAAQASGSRGRDGQAAGRSLREATGLSADQPDPVVTAVLDHFPAGRLWQLAHRDPSANCGPTARSAPPADAR